jgi:2-polyprenyl-3-methyl-5-hydroxy-6-metoxy-1,4-benzoquinol methylase
MRSLAARVREDEQMDEASLDELEYAAVLNDLERVNVWTFAARPTLDFLARGTRGMKRFSLLDVGFGQGDMLRRIARWAGKRGIAAELVGVDLNAKSESVARTATPADLPIDYRTGDYRDQGRFDFIVSSLVAHHMSDEELLAFLRHMESESRRGWLVNDLHRHPFPYLGFPLLARLLGVHRIVREDGQLSIARAFRPAEWRSILEAAGIAPGAAQIRRYFPFRLCVERLS